MLVNRSNVFRVKVVEGGWIRGGAKTNPFTPAQRRTRKDLDQILGAEVLVLREGIPTRGLVGPVPHDRVVEPGIDAGASTAWLAECVCISRNDAPGDARLCSSLHLHASTIVIHPAVGDVYKTAFCNNAKIGVVRDRGISDRYLGVRQTVHPGRATNDARAVNRRRKRADREIGRAHV